MCMTCGCSSDEEPTITRIEQTHAYSHSHEHSHLHSHEHQHAHAHSHEHTHEHLHSHEHAHSHPHPHDHSHVQQQGPMKLSVEEKVLAKNNTIADSNRRWLRKRQILALNILSSPGAGKTSILERTIADMKERSVFVLEGDQATSCDAQRIKSAGAPVVQINTGSGCHLDADMISRALIQLDPDEGSLLFIENVGNLVCPALFDLGEELRVVILSVTEGEDKALKYPQMFIFADLLVLNKIDLLPHLNFNLEACIGNVHSVNPGLGILQVSATSGLGLESWYKWVDGKRCAII